MQRITTREPTEDMLEIAIISIKCALRDDFDEFKEFYELEGWVAKEATGPEEAEENPTPDAEGENAQ